MFCTNCGQSIEDDAVYCNHCGNRICNVGDNVGNNVGDNVGNNVGDNVGNNVGDNVGNNVGNNVDVAKYISKKSIMLCVSLLILGLTASTISIIKLYMSGKDLNDMFGQIIFGSIFIISIILLWKSRKIGIAVLVPFILFKMICSVYYFDTFSGYAMKNLIADEVLYVIIILLSIIGWTRPKIEAKT